MSQVKRLMEAQEGLRQIAFVVLCKVDALDECEIHEGYYFDGGSDPEDAYKLANAQVTKGEIELPGGMTRRDMTDAIKDVYEEYSGASSCTYCENIASKD